LIAGWFKLCNICIYQNVQIYIRNDTSNPLTLNRTFSYFFPTQNMLATQITIHALLEINFIVKFTIKLFIRGPVMSFNRKIKKKKSLFLRENNVLTPDSKPSTDLKFIHSSSWMPMPLVGKCTALLSFSKLRVKRFSFNNIFFFKYVCEHWRNNNFSRM